MAQTKLEKIRSNAFCYMGLLPTYALLAVFSLIPFVWAFTKSFYEFEVGGESNFVGFNNYREYLFKDPTFLPSLINMALLTAFHVLTVIVFPLTVAKLIFSLKSERWRHAYRVAFLLPIVVPGVAVQMIWSGIIYSESGLVNEICRVLGKPEWVHAWLSEPNTVLWSLAFMGFPFVGGINVLIYYAGLAAIPDSVHEAAKMDGASGIGKFLKIDVPMIFSQIKLMVTLTIIHGIQGFEGIFVLTRGGPGFKSMVPGLWMYFNAFSFQKMGYACAIGVLLFVLIMMLTVLNMKYFKTTEQMTGGKKR